MNKYDYNNLTPFKWFVLENFPFIEADFDALTNWQLFCKLGKEMNKLIDTMNNVGQGMEDFSQELINSFNEFTTEINTTVEDYITRFNQLKDFVDNYFENLDVQEEINNKLDDMVEAGTLQEIITNYLNAKAIFCFDTLEDMKEATNLIDGSFAKILGYYTKNDGGETFFTISENGNDFSILLDNGLYANRVYKNEVNPIQFGAKCNGTDDDAQYIRIALNYLATNGGGTLNLLDNKIYILANADNGAFIHLKNNCNIIGNSILKIKDNLGDWLFLFNLIENVDNIILKDFIIDENTTNNSITENTGLANYERVIFRILAYNYYFKNAIFENITVNDCTGVWQYEFEGQCENIKINNCTINYNNTENANYDRTSIYLGIKNCIISNCLLNGSNNARTGIELHGTNIICSNNIINNYSSGIYITNDNMRNTVNKNEFLLVCDNKIQVRGRGIMNWFTFNNIEVDLIDIHSNFVKILNSEVVNPSAIANWDILATENSKIKNLKIYDNTIISERESGLSGLKFASTSSSVNFLIENFEIKNNTLKGYFNQFINLASNSNNTFKIKNLVIDNNNFNITNQTNNLFYLLLREGIDKITIKNNIINMDNIPSYVFRVYGTNSAIEFSIIDNLINKDLTPLQLLNSENIYVYLKQIFETLILTSDSTSNYLKATNFKCKNGSIIEDKNYNYKKYEDWICNYRADTMKKHIPVTKGSIFQLSNDTNSVKIATKSGFIPDHEAGTNLAGEWVNNSGSVVVFQSLTDNNLPASDSDPTNFKYIGQTPNFSDI